MVVAQVVVKGLTGGLSCATTTHNHLLKDCRATLCSTQDADYTGSQEPGFKARLMSFLLVDTVNFGTQIRAAMSPLLPIYQIFLCLVRPLSFENASHMTVGDFSCSISSTLNVLQVEDMLKRSFAEFRAQSAAPEQQALLVKGQAALEALRAHPWPHSMQGTSRGDVEQFYSLCHRIEQLGADVQVSSFAQLPHASVVIWRHQWCTCDPPTYQYPQDIGRLCIVNVPDEVQGL